MIFLLGGKLKAGQDEDTGNVVEELRDDEDEEVEEHREEDVEVDGEAARDEVSGEEDADEAADGAECAGGRARRGGRSGGLKRDIGKGASFSPTNTFMKINGSL